MDKAYSRIIWVNQPSTATALGATNLNRIDVAINTIDDRVVGMDTSKADQSVVNNVVKSITYNDATGVLTITKVNNTSTTIDTKLEKLAVNFSYNPTTQQLDITLDDGTVQHVDMSALVTQYEFNNTSTVSFTLTNGVITANVVNGSITADKLQPDYLADITVQAGIATAQAGIATEKADDAQTSAEQAELAKIAAELARDQAVDISNVGVAGINKLGLVNGNGNVTVNADASMWADQYKDKDTKTGTSTQFTTADDGLIQISNIIGASSQTSTNQNKQLFDKVKALTTKYMQPATGTITTSSYNNNVSPPILVSAGSSYSISGHTFVQPNTPVGLAWFNSRGVYISGVSYQNLSGNGSYTAPTGAFYAKYTINNVDLNTSQFELGTATSYASFIPKSPSSDYPSVIISATNFNFLSSNSDASKTNQINVLTSSELRRILGSNAYDEQLLQTDLTIKNIQRISKFVFNGTENWNLSSTYSNTMRFTYTNSLIKVNTRAMSDKFIEGTAGTDTENIDGHGSSNILQITVNKYKLPTQDLVGFKAWLASNNVTIYYELATPIETILPTKYYLTSYKGITNVYTTANPQVTFTAVAKSELWSKNYSINQAIGDRSQLPTPNTDLVSGINEVNTNVGGLSSLLTTIKTSIVGAINEIIGKIGDLTTLTTTSKTNIVSSINEVNNKLLPKTMRIDGDSFCVMGDGKAGHLFWERIVKGKNIIATNSGASGYKINDVWHLINLNLTIPSPYDIHLINVGFNDMRSKGDNSKCAKDVATRLRGIIAFLRLQSARLSNDASITYVGSWQTISSPLETGDFHSPSVKYTSAQNAYFETTFSGDGFTFGTFFLETAGSTLEIKVDNVVVETIYTGEQSVGDYAPTAIELFGFGQGTHTLRITKTSSDTYNVFCDYIGIPKSTTPKIYVNGITKMRDDMYAMYSPYNKGSDSTVLGSNKELRKILASFDGNVAFVDQSDYDPDNISDLLTTDNVHPGTLGHEWLASNIFKRWQ